MKEEENRLVGLQFEEASSYGVIYEDKGKQ